jgi:ketosteroid isomerase-like protein
MSRENVEIVRALIPPPEIDLVVLPQDDRAFEALADAVGDLAHPDLECVAVWQQGRVYKGLDGLREMWRDWLEPWASYHSHVDQMIDAGDRVVVLAYDRGRRDDTDVEVDIRAGSVWELRDGRLARVEFFGDRDGAIAAAGLSEKDLE